MTPTTLLLLALSHRTIASSIVAIYLDAECSDPTWKLAASNGYPDGLCTNVSHQTSDAFQSFQFLSLDDGCAPTVYQGSDDDGCSGFAFLAEIGTCYNTTWVDYSVDGCTAPSSNVTAGNTTVTTSAPSVALPTVTATATTSPSSTGSTPSSTPSADSGASVGILNGSGGLTMSAAILSVMYLVLL